MKINPKWQTKAANFSKTYRLIHELWILVNTRIQFRLRINVDRHSRLATAIMPPYRVASPRGRRVGKHAVHLEYLLDGKRLFLLLLELDLQRCDLGIGGFCKVLDDLVIDSVELTTGKSKMPIVRNGMEAKARIKPARETEWSRSQPQAEPSVGALMAPGQWPCRKNINNHSSRQARSSAHQKLHYFSNRLLLIETQEFSYSGVWNKCRTFESICANWHEISGHRTYPRNRRIAAVWSRLVLPRCRTPSNVPGSSTPQKEMDRCGRTPSAFHSYIQ